MKQFTKGLNLKMFMTFLMIAFLQTVIFAQEEGQGSGAANAPIGSSGSSTTTTTKSVVSHSSDWYASPWVWVAGAVVLILLLVSILRGGSSSTRSEKVTVTKSSSTD